MKNRLKGKVWRENLSKSLTGKKYPTDLFPTRGMKNKKHSKKFKKKSSASHISFCKNHPEVCRAHAETMKNLWKKEEWREKQIKLILKGLIKRPTSFEQKIIDLCKEYNLPFKYTGNGEIIINYVNPDFVYTGERKMIIETYFSLWHPKNYRLVRRKRLGRCGYKTLFLDEDDLCCKNWKNICLRKINKFLV